MRKIAEARSSFIFPGILFLLTCNVSVQAVPFAPDAGQTSQELQEQPEIVPQESPEVLQPERDSAQERRADDLVHFSVTAIRVSGSSIFSADELEALVSDMVGSERTLAELEAAAGQITAHYRSRGYLVARAYLPAQEIKDGVVRIDVLEGKLGEQRINNLSRLSDEQVYGYLGSIRRGEALQVKTADRALLLLNDTPGVGSAKATLQPGASVGTSDLVVELTPAAPYSVKAELDNYGNRYTGETRLGAGIALNSPLRVGDQVSLNALTTDQHLSYVRIAYQLPVGNDGVRLGAAYSSTRYRLGKEFSGLQASGNVRNAGLYAMYPVIRSQVTNLSVIATWERKKLNDSTDVPVTSSEKQLQLTNVGIAGNHQDAWGRGGITSFDLSWTTGKLDMDAISLAADLSSAKSNGSYTLLNYSIKRLQRLTATNALWLALSRQQASKNLNSSEKLYLGGAQSVRAYPQGEVSGDQGYLVNIELRHDHAFGMQGVIFYDFGAVKINKNAYIVSAENSRLLAGAGIGVNANVGGIQVKASLAWRTRGGEPTSVTSTRNPRLWLLAGKQF